MRINVRVVIAVRKSEYYGQILLKLLVGMRSNRLRKWQNLQVRIIVKTMEQYSIFQHKCKFLQANAFKKGVNKT